MQIAKGGMEIDNWYEPAALSSVFQRIFRIQRLDMYSYISDNWSQHVTTEACRLLEGLPAYVKY